MTVSLCTNPAMPEEMHLNSLSAATWVGAPWNGVGRERKSSTPTSYLIIFFLLILLQAETLLLHNVLKYVFNYISESEVFQDNLLFSHHPAVHHHNAFLFANWTKDVSWNGENFFLTWMLVDWDWWKWQSSGRSSMKINRPPPQRG